MTTFDLTSISTANTATPPRIVLYGVHGIGKTTFAASAPSPILLPTEKGAGVLRVPKFPKVGTYADACGAINTLLTQPHPYSAAIVDTLDWLEPLIWAETARRANKKDIEDFGFGKGYLAADEVWGELLAGLDALNEQRGMTIILIAHSEIVRFNSPTSEPYDRYDLKLHKRAKALVQEWADVVGFAHYEVHTASTDAGFNKKVVRGVGAGNRLLALEERPAYYAKNRYSLPSTLPLSWSAFAAACAPAFEEEEEGEERKERLDKVIDMVADIAEYADTLTD